ncbi:LytR C-terminal domain-containing protein [Nocardioides jiangxiensis]|uniref:LytR C-terminal domain-containing protein n=1 Tax=Nocardioides jiangxiensis TaxID=3064524 RepID=A0ABT9AZY2_9ACTN|nr:LytR C-terminal domain-containing protein [Nocardioides sp. WY-20]MDO7868012.1 LytR C-terminal domain-containing protein [Nocardioides sp. WY-20]
METRETSGPTLAFLVGTTLLMLVVGFIWATRPFPSLSSYSDSSRCVDTQVAAGQKVHPSEVLVSVFNAGRKSGGAGTAMKKLMRRGFAPGDTGNAGTASVRKVEIWADPSSPAAQLVAAQFGSGTPIVSGKPVLGDGIVVVVGDGLRAWHPKVAAVTAEADTYICGPKVP